MLALVLVLAPPAAPLAAFEWTSARPWFAGSSVGARGGSSAGGGRGSEAGAKRALEETAVHDHRKRPVKIAANGDEDDANLLQCDMLEPPAWVMCKAWVSAAAIHVSLMLATLMLATHTRVADARDTSTAPAIHVLLMLAPRRRQCFSATSANLLCMCARTRHVCARTARVHVHVHVLVRGVRV